MTPPAATTTTFASSLIPMVLADDERRLVDANAAACLLLRMPRERVLELTIDDLTPAEARGAVEGMWRQFLADGVQSGTYDLAMPDGGLVHVDYSATASHSPGRHLSILMPRYGNGADAGAQPEGAERGLTERELEILALVAMGRASGAIAATLGISAATVDTHVRNCLEKLGARNRAHAIALALQRGLITMTAEEGDPAAPVGA